MRRTYAYNSIIFGALLGMLVYASTESVALGIIVCLAVSVVGFIIIRLIENAIDKGVDKIADKATEAHRRRKAQRMEREGVYTPRRQTTQFPVTSPAAAAPAPASYQAPTYQRTSAPSYPISNEAMRSATERLSRDCGITYRPASAQTAEFRFCRQCGTKMRQGACFCPVCGSAVIRKQF